MSRYTGILLLLVIVKCSLPFFLPHPVYELHRDEYLYYAQGEHLSLGFLENPPLISVLARLSALAGGAPFWIRFWPAFFGAGTLVLLAGIIRELGGKSFALIISGIGLLFTAYLRVHFLFQPNFLDIFFWTLALYCLLRLTNTERPRYFYLLALALALGWWSKYSMLFLIAAICLSLLLTRRRRYFASRHFWLAAGFGMLLVLPNLAWQWVHNWPLLHHMQELQETQLRYLSKADFIKEQLLLLLPVAFVWIGGLIWLLRQQQYRILGLVYPVTIALILFGSGKGYYALPLYPFMLGAGSVWLERITERRKGWRYAAVACILLLALPAVPVLMPMQEPREMAEFNKKYGLAELGLLRWEDQQDHALQQDFADMIGWKELTRKAEDFFHRLPDSVQKHTVVFCRNYGQAGALKYHAQHPSFREKVITDNGTHLLWIPDPLRFRHLLFIGRELPEKDDIVFQHFSRTVLVDSVTNHLSRQYGDKVIFFEGADEVAGQLANEGLREMRARFNRK